MTARMAAYLNSCLLIAWLTIRKNTAYFWAHMGNNVGSALFGFIYMALWKAAANGHAVGNMTSTHLVNYIALSQTVLWISTFLPNNLGVANHIRTGQIAVEFVRPIGYFSRTLSGGAGEVLYNVFFRSAPLAFTFTLLGVMPWGYLHGGMRVFLVVASFALAGMGGLLFQYLIGICAFWTTETRWARRLFLGLVTLCGGQLLPLSLMPAGVRVALSWLPFQALVSFPVVVWMRMDHWQVWCSSVGWVLVLFVLSVHLTRRGQKRVEVQGG